MAVIINDLIECLKRQKVELIAGENGMQRGVSFPHIVENLEIAKFLVGGEIVFINGIAISEEMPLKKLFRDIYKHNASAVIIFKGPYISEIDQEIIDFSNENSFPLFWAPWEVYCANVIRAIITKISEFEKWRTQMEVALKGILLGNIHKEDFEDFFLENNWNQNGVFTVTLVNIIEKNSGKNIAGKRIENLKNSINMGIISQEESIGVVKVKEMIAIVFCDIDNDRIKEIVPTVARNVKRFCNDKEEYCIVVGKKSIGVENVCKSYNNAVKMLRLGVKMSEEIDNHVINYEESDLYKLLIEIDDTAVIRDFYEQTIAPLEQYDEYHNTELCKTLQYYMKYNGSVMKVSEKLFVHRNTIGKQINKIESLLEVDLSEWETRTKFMIALMLKELFQMK